MVIMRLLQYNIQSFKNNKDALEVHLIKNGYDIFCLSETLSKENQVNKIQDFNMIERKRSDGWGGVAIGLRRNIRYKIINYETNSEIIMVRTLNLRRNFILVSCYFPPSVENDRFGSEVRDLFRFLDPCEDVLVMGDFNAHNRCWGDSVTSVKGRMLSDIVDQYGFGCMNNGNYTFRPDMSSERGTVLDLTFMKTDRNWEWDTLPFLLGGSHHSTIEIVFPECRIFRGKFLAKRKLMENLSRIELPTDSVRIMESFRSEIEGCTYKIGDSRTPKYWWHKGLEPYYMRFVAARKKCQGYPSYGNWEELSGAKREWEKVAREARREIWIEP